MKEFWIDEEMNCHEVEPKHLRSEDSNFSATLVQVIVYGILKIFK